MQTAPDFYNYKPFALLIGDLVFAGLPGEPFTEIGRRITEAFPFKEVILCTITNAITTYFLTTKSLCEGGYEAGTSNMGKGSDDILVGGMRELYQKLKN